MFAVDGGEHVGLGETIVERVATCDEVKAFTLDHAAEIGHKIADLRKLEGVLREMAAQCDRGNVPDCPIVEALTHRAPRPV